MTEQKIREAFEKAKVERMVLPEAEKGDLAYYLFKSGYMALLNELEPTHVAINDQGVAFSSGSAFVDAHDDVHRLYRLPEGVTK